MRKVTLTVAMIGVLVILGCGGASTTSNATGGGNNQTDTGTVGANLSGLQIFPSSNPWNTPIDTAAVDPNSAALIASIGNTTGLHPDFGANWNGGPFGIPYVTVGPNQRRKAVTFEFSDESDPGPYPIPANAPIEGGTASTGDRHVLVVDTTNKLLYELFDAHPQPNGSWQAGSGAIFNLQTGALRPAGWTSADAAGLPILAGLVRYDEVSNGEIKHALRFTVNQTRRAYVSPARHWASSHTNPNFPPMGMRVRLKASFDISGFRPQSQVILRALKKYGMMVADNGSNWFISGAPDSRWDDDDLNELKSIQGSNFEVVQMGTITAP